jgi:hypothetical protein
MEVALAQTVVVAGVVAVLLGSRRKGNAGATDQEEGASSQQPNKFSVQCHASSTAFREKALQHSNLFGNAQLQYIHILMAFHRRLRVLL